MKLRLFKRRTERKNPELEINLHRRADTGEPFVTVDPFPRTPQEMEYANRMARQMLAYAGVVTDVKLGPSRRDRVVLCLRRNRYWIPIWLGCMVLGNLIGRWL